MEGGKQNEWGNRRGKQMGWRCWSVERATGNGQRLQIRPGDRKMTDGEKMKMEGGPWRNGGGCYTLYGMLPPGQLLRWHSRLEEVEEERGKRPW